MRLGRHGGTKFSVPVSKNVDQMNKPPGSSTWRAEHRVYRRGHERAAQAVIGQSQQTLRNHRGAT